MSTSRNVPAAVVTAVVLTVVLALLFGGVVSYFGFADGEQDLAIGGLVIGALLLALAWRLWRGTAGARVAGVAVGVLVILGGFLQHQGPAPFIAFAALGLALILLLTVPASVRTYFQPKPKAVSRR